MANVNPIIKIIEESDFIDDKLLLLSIYENFLNYMMSNLDKNTNSIVMIDLEACFKHLLIENMKGPKTSSPKNILSNYFLSLEEVLAFDKKSLKVIDNYRKLIFKKINDYSLFTKEINKSSKFSLTEQKEIFNICQEFLASPSTYYANDSANNLVSFEELDVYLALVLDDYLKSNFTNTQIIKGLKYYLYNMTVCYLRTYKINPEKDNSNVKKR